MGDWFVGLGYEAQLATWLVASVFIYAIASQVAWHSQWVVFPSPPSPEAVADGPSHEEDLDGEPEKRHWLEQLQEHPLVPWLEELLRFVYFLGIPFMAIISGWLGADLLGIRGTEWMAGQSVQGFLWEDWVRGLALVTATILGVAVAWLVSRLIARKSGLTAATQGVPDPLWRQLLDVFYLQLHWAFYRSGPILWLDDLYWGAMIGLGLVLLEMSLNPAFWWTLKSPETAGPPLFRLAMAWVSTLLFITTHNLWLTAGAHLVLTILIWGTTAQKPAHLDQTA
jgi:hypothetical protein